MLRPWLTAAIPVESLYCCSCTLKTCSAAQDAGAIHRILDICAEIRGLSTVLDARHFPFSIALVRAPHNMDYPPTRRP